MKVFWNNLQLTHTPQFFLARGKVRPNFEIPARAESLLAECRELGLPIAAAPPIEKPRMESLLRSIG